MKIFISFSGPRSRAVARILHEWLPSVLQNTKPWFSEEISSGKRWSPEIAKQLEETQFGIVCLTQENLDERWIHFEAGACSKSVKDDARVVPYLLDVATPQVEGPMAEFQMRLADEQGTRHMVKDLNLLLGQQGLRDDQFAKAFDMWWPELKEKLAGIPPMEGPKPAARAEREMIEEVLERQRRIENILSEKLLSRAQQSSESVATILGRMRGVNMLINPYGTGEGLSDDHPSMHTRNTLKDLYRGALEDQVMPEDKKSSEVTGGDRDGRECPSSAVDWGEGRSRPSLSSKPGMEEALRVKPDGRVMNGNHGVTVLMERGVDVNALPREIVK